MKLAIAGACVAAALGFGLAAPAGAADFYTLGNLVNVQAVHVEDGQFETYLEYLDGEFKRQSDYAVSQGWNVSYRILENINARKGEPDIYILREFKDFPSAAEIERRDKLTEEFTKQSAKQADAASGARKPMRTLGSNTQLRELKLK